MHHLQNADAVASAEIEDLAAGVLLGVLEMVNTFSEVNHVPVPYVIGPRRAGDLATVYADPAKAKTVLGWEAKKTVADMCRDSWNWQSKNPNGY